MNILLCSPCRLDRTLGAAQTLMDLADALGALGHTCDLVGPGVLGASAEDYPARLQAFLRAEAGGYDVVDLDYKRCVLDEQTARAGPLFVARCQLLIHHYLRIPIPPMPTLRGRLRDRVLGPRDRHVLRARIQRADATLAAAHRIVVLNGRDRDALAQQGHAAEKIHVIPNGMTADRLDAFAAVPEAVPEGAVVAFIGMFGPRKGAADFPDLVRRVAASVPEVRFRLLGTRGPLRTAEAVEGLFPKALRRHVEVIPTFAPEALPELLAPCAVGVFPSYVEGFGLGVLEMLAAAMPVVAYDAPGPPVMLPPEALVPRGDTAAMSERVIALLRDRAALAGARRRARQQAQTFTWARSARRLADAYEDALSTHPNPHSA